MKKVYFFIIIILIGACKKESLFSPDYTGNLPKLDITINENYLWSPDSGLYVIGINGAEKCGPIANYNQKWEYPAEIEYVENGHILFSDDVGLRIKGGCSRMKSMKSFGLYWRGKYGNNMLNYPIFKNSNLNSFKRLFVRNSGNDFGETHIKDISIISIVQDYGDFEFQEYQQCVVYLNDHYWGIYNLREMITPHHFENHFGFPKDNIDLLEGSELYPHADDGTIDNYTNTVLGFIQNHDLSDDVNYQYISNLIDINSYIDYIIVNTYICNKDWPNNNVKWWKDRTNNNSKWRWVLYDTDQAFQLNNVEHLWIGDLIGNYLFWPESKYSTPGAFYLFNNLITNSDFLDSFLARYMYFIENVFEPSRVELLIRNNQNRIDSDYGDFHVRWSVANKSEWNKNITALIDFNNKRHEFMKTVIENLINENN